MKLFKQSAYKKITGGKNNKKSLLYIIKDKNIEKRVPYVS